MNKLSSIVVSVPHASTDVPDDIRPLLACDDRAIKARADLYTDRLYDIPGTRTVRAPYSRMVTDVNRAPDAFFREGRQRMDAVVPLSFSNGTNVYTEDPSPETAREWVRRFHAPYHAQLAQTLQGASFLLDGHSMRTTGTKPRAGADNRPDVALGNLHYTTASADVSEFFRERFAALGYTVGINKPFPGRFTIGYHCHRDTLPGLQVELRRELYMNEKTLEPDDAAITRIRDELRAMVGDFAEWHSVA
jgi:formiminoglutamase